MAIILDAAAVDRLLPQIDTLAEMRRLFHELGKGLAVQPPQTLTLFPEGRGDFITYLGALAEKGVFGAKLSPYLPTDEGAVVTAWTCLMSMTTGQPLMLCDSGRLTTERTAGTTALAVDLLASRGASRLAVIGAGAIAEAHLRHALPLREWRGIRLFSPRLADDPARQDRWRGLCPDLTVVDTARDAAADADVVMLCTSSGTPVLDPTALTRHALVTSISTNAAQAHEIPPAFLNHAQVYCDFRATTPQAAGDMLIAMRNHGWNPAEIRGDLGELTCGQAPLPDQGRPVFFRSVGLGIEDIAMAHAIHNIACVQD